MNITIKNKQVSRLFVFLSVVVVVSACDKIGDISSGGGGGGDGVQAAGEKVADTSGENSGDMSSENPGGTNGDVETQVSKNSVVRLNAFTDFNCTSNWRNRDGGLGLKVGSRKGTCKTTFSGGSGPYNIQLAAQTEREGQSPYRISINDQLANSGKFPYAQGKRICSCRQPWQRYCPDVVMQLDAGVHNLDTGDVIEFYGEEEYLCGKHGAYAKWKGMVFTPAD